MLCAVEGSNNYWCVVITDQKVKQINISKNLKIRILELFQHTEGAKKKVLTF
jgi:hypothetical protein